MSRIAVIGSGAVGSYYGARLNESGHDVNFLLRSSFDTILTNGLHIESIDGNIDLPAPNIFRNTSEIGTVDWVICALKATAMDVAQNLITPCIGEHTRIIALMNGLGVEEEFNTWFPETQIFGGLAFTCINRSDSGRVRHLDYGSVTLGHLGDDAEELNLIKELWSHSKVTTFTAPSLLAARWEKLCWNVPFNGLTVTSGGITTDVVMNDSRLRKSAEGLIHELVMVGNADLKQRKVQQSGISIQMDAEEILDTMMTRTEKMTNYRPSTMIDFVEGREMEVEAIFEAPLRRATELGLDTPLLKIITGQIHALGRG